MPSPLLPVPAQAIGGGLSAEAIRDGERRLGATLPEAYVRLLRSANGVRLRAVVVPPGRGAPPLDLRVLAGIRPEGSGVNPDDLVGYNAYFTVEKGFRPEGSIAFGHGAAGTFVLFCRGPRAGRVAFVDRTSRRVRLVAASLEAFLSRLAPRTPPPIALASSAPRAREAPRAPVPRRPEPTPRPETPRDARTWSGVDFGTARLRAGATVRDARAVDCTFGGRSCDPRRFTTFERVELVNARVAARLCTNLVCRDVTVTGCKSGAKTLSLVNVLCSRTRLVGDFSNLFFRMDADHLPRGSASFVATFYEGVEWALDLRAARFRQLTLRGVPGHLVLRDPERHAVILTERLAEDRSWRRLEAGTVAILEHALARVDESHVLCASDFLPSGPAERRRIARLRARGLVD